MILAKHIAEAGSQHAIVRAVCDGSFLTPDVFPVTLTDGVHELQLTGTSDAIRIGSPNDYVRPVVTHRTAQAIADLMGMVVPSAKMMDAMADQAPIQLQSYSAPHAIDPKRLDGISGGNFVRSERVAGTIRMDRASMEEESDRIDRMINAVTGIPMGSPLPPGLAINQVGKVWITDPVLLFPEALTYGKESGVNYGFWDTAAPRPSMSSKKYKVWQRPGTFHDWDHGDYSQRLVLFNRKGAIRGGKYGSSWKTVDIDDIAKDKATAGLLFVGGTPMAMRHPWLPVFERGDCHTMVASGPGGKGGGGVPSGGGNKPPPVPGVPTPKPEPVVASKATEVQYWLVGIDVLGAASPAAGMYLRHDSVRRPPTPEQDAAAASELRTLAQRSQSRGGFEVRKMVWPLDRLPGGIPDLRVSQVVLDRFTLGGIVPGGGANV